MQQRKIKNKENCGCLQVRACVDPFSPLFQSHRRYQVFFSFVLVEVSALIESNLSFVFCVRARIPISLQSMYGLRRQVLLPLGLIPSGQWQVGRSTSRPVSLVLVYFPAKRKISAIFSNQSRLSGQTNPPPVTRSERARILIKGCHG